MTQRESDPCACMGARQGVCEWMHLRLRASSIGGLYAVAIYMYLLLDRCGMMRGGAVVGAAQSLCHQVEAVLYK